MNNPSVIAVAKKDTQVLTVRSHLNVKWVLMEMPANLEFLLEQLEIVAAAVPEAIQEVIVRMLFLAREERISILAGIRVCQMVSQDLVSVSVLSVLLGIIAKLFSFAQKLVWYAKILVLFLVLLQHKIVNAFVILSMKVIFAKSQNLVLFWLMDKHAKMEEVLLDY
jgi:hypothetical protein